MKTVRIFGAAKNARESPPLTPEDKDVEVWLSNSTTTNLIRCPQAMSEWTRWFNLHSRAHIVGTYPAAFTYYQTKAEGRPICLLKVQPDVPTSIAFPRKQIQEAFATAKGPNRYFTCTVTWLIALAIFEGFERIELWGFALRDTKPGSVFAYERPCFAYWVQMAKDRGIEVFYQEAVETLYQAKAMIAGDPDTYTGTLYGYGTKPDVGWNPVTEEFDTL